MIRKIVIVGSGTAGLVAAHIIRGMFPFYEITIVSSEQIGIIGVGEGSTEHWRIFQDLSGIAVDDMVKHADITHKYGIRYENWTNHTPDYFHSVGGLGPTVGSFLAGYAYALSNGKQLTPLFSWKGLTENKIIDQGENTHLGTNQYHFDTFKLNSFLRTMALNKNIRIVNDEVTNAHVDEYGFISTITLKSGNSLYGDFFIDASGFSRALLSKITDNDFVAYRKYLPCDTAIAFPTPMHESGQIRPYTRARALSSGWMWEIPTQERRGNGYVFASDFITVEEAIREASEVHGFEVTPAKVINFQSGYFRTTWKNNCFAIGLAAAFVEPLEATSISTTIQQVRLLCSYLPTFSHQRMYGIREYHRIIDSVMENILTMISLHYISDRTDSEMWRAQAEAPRPELLNHLLALWNERCPEAHDIPTTGYELFGAPHLWHVANGQGVLNPEIAEIQLSHYGSLSSVRKFISSYSQNLLTTKLIDHAEALARTKNS